MESARQDTLRPEPAGPLFVGRGPELAQLRAALDAAIAGRSEVVLVEGEPGIGKTRTVEVLASEASRRGTTVLWGRCWEGEGAPAFWPWRQVLRSLAEQADTREILSEIGSRAAPLAELMPELGAFDAGTITDLPPEPEHARFRLFDSVATLLRHASRREPLVLVLDDLHWSDQPSLLLLHFVARELRDAQVLILGTYRKEEISRTSPLGNVLGRLARDSRHVSLKGLPRAEVASFLEATAGAQLSPELIDAVHARSEGNPFFVIEIVRLLDAEGRLRSIQDLATALEIPQSIRLTIGRRLARLPPAPRRVLAAASVIGRSFPLALLHPALTGDALVAEGTLLEALDQAKEAGLVLADDGAVATFRFSHALVREALYEDLSTDERMRLHARAGAALEQLCRTSVDPPLAELARHFVAALPRGDAVKAADYALRAGQQAVAALAFEDAVNHYTVALRTLDALAQADERKVEEGPWPEPEESARRRCAIWLALGDAQALAAQAPQARQTFLGAASLARKLGAPDLLARAALGAAGRGDVLTGPDAKLLALLEEALSSIGSEPTTLRARLLARLATALYFTDAADRRAELSREAVEIAERAGDPAALAFCLGARHMALLGPDYQEERLAVANRVVQLATRANAREVMAGAHLWRLFDYLERGDIPAVDRELRSYTQLAQELRQPFFLWQATALRAMRLQLEGRLEEAEVLALEALAHGRRARSPNAELLFSVQLFVLRREQGRLDELEESIRLAVEQYPELPAFRCGLALIYSELGRVTEARAQLDQLAASDFLQIPRDAGWLSAMGELAQTCAFLGDAARAARVYDLLLPYAGLNVVVSFAEACDGAVSRYLGLLARTMERWEESLGHFAEAMAFNSAMGATPFVAHVQRDWAETLLRRDAPGDRAEARSLLTAAAATYASLGMEHYRARAEALPGTVSPSPQEQQDAVILSHGVRSGPETASLPQAATRVFRREGELWTIGDESELIRLRDAKGLRYIALLLEHPNHELHVAELISTIERAPVAAPLPASDTRPDPRAVSEYRQRLADLDAEIALAERNNDFVRLERLRHETDLVTHELSQIFGRGGRARHASEPSEKMRKAVANRIREGIGRISRAHPAIGHHLARSIRTGVFCAYSPETPSRWRL